MMKEAWGLPNLKSGGKERGHEVFHMGKLEMNESQVSGLESGSSTESETI